MKAPVKARAKWERRKLRIDAELKAQAIEARDRSAYLSSQAVGSNEPIRVCDIPYTRFEG